MARPRKGGYIVCKACKNQLYTKPSILKTKIYCSIKCHMKDLGPWNKGKHGLYSEEYRRKIVEALHKRVVSLETRRKKSLVMKKRVKLGVHNFWKGGVTRKSTLIRSSGKYRSWRKAVFKRDNWTCQKCQSRCEKGQNVYLQAHHLKSFAEYPKLRFIVSNGLTLCRECHKLTDNYLKHNKWQKKNLKTR